MKLGGLGELGMITVNGATQIRGQPTGIGPLLDQPDLFGSSQGLMELVRLPGQQLSQNRSGGGGRQEVTLPACPGMTGRVETLLRVIKGRLHKDMEGQGALGPNQPGELLCQEGLQGCGYLIGGRRRGRD